MTQIDCAFGGFLRTGVRAVLLMAALGSSVGARAERKCDEDAFPPDDGESRYTLQDQGKAAERCEGFFVALRSGEAGFILTSLTSARAFSPDAMKVARLAFRPIDPSKKTEVVVQRTSEGEPYYRMDAAAAPNTTTFDWPLVLAASFFSSDGGQLGFTAFFKAEAARDDVYFPVALETVKTAAAVAPLAPPTATTIEVDVMPRLTVEDAKLTLLVWKDGGFSNFSIDGAGLPGSKKDLPKRKYDIGERVSFTLKSLPKGEYLLKVSGYAEASREARDGGTPPRVPIHPLSVKIHVE